MFIVFYQESDPDEDFYQVEWDAVPRIGETICIPDSYAADKQQEETTFEVKSINWRRYSKSGCAELIVSPVPES